jgi:hypothetical protein
MEGLFSVVRRGQPYLLKKEPSTKLILEQANWSKKKGIYPNPLWQNSSESQAKYQEGRNKYPMHIIQTRLFDSGTFMSKKGNDRLAMVLEALPAEALISALEKEHWTGRKRYSVRRMWSPLIAGD